MIIDGKEVAKNVKERLKEEIRALKELGIIPSLTVILVGDDKASQVYVRNKEKACEELSINSNIIRLPKETTQDELINLIDELNEDKSVDGILVQLPLPRTIDEKTILSRISKDKDVDCFNPINSGRLFIGDPIFLPCTPAGIIELINSVDIDIQSKNCVVIGRSNIVGKPISILMLQNNATVTICHSKTKELNSLTKKADILICAIGKPKFIKEDMVKEGAVVIDVGMNRDEDNKLCGDVDFESVKDKASYITPVPGGVGPMTIAMLMQNTVKAAKLKERK